MVWLWQADVRDLQALSMTLNILFKQKQDFPWVTDPMEDLADGWGTPGLEAHQAPLDPRINSRRPWFEDPPALPEVVGDRIL